MLDFLENIEIAGEDVVINPTDVMTELSMQQFFAQQKLVRQAQRDTSVMYETFVPTHIYTTPIVTTQIDIRA